MKVYIIMHKGSPNASKAGSWVDIEEVKNESEQIVYVKLISVRAFLKKKEAKKWLEEKGWDHLVIKTAIIQ